MTQSTQALCFLLGSIAIGTAALGQDRQIVVQAVDGRNGKPIANQRLLVFGGDSPQAVRQHKKSYELETDNDGLAALTVAAEIRWVQVWMDWHALCQSEPNDKSFAVTDILASGVSTPNTCRKVAQKATQGRLVVFARPYHWWEKIRR